MQAELRRRFPGEKIVSVVGLRRDESRSRAKIPISSVTGYSSGGVGEAAKTMLSWHPIADWTEHDVYRFHTERQVELHEAYTVWGASRMGCSFCVLASFRNLEPSTAAPGNRQSFALITDLEIESGFSFQPGRWLGDVAPGLLSGAKRSALEAAKASAVRRRALEADLPSGLRFQKGWPPRMPTISEADQIANVRNEILAQHNLVNLYPLAADVLGRFHELHAARSPG